MGEGPLTPYPLSLANVHPAWREGGSGRAAEQLGWAVGQRSGRHRGRLALGKGPGWVIFQTIMGLNIHSFLLSKLEIPLR